MTTASPRPQRRVRHGEPVEYPAPPPEIAAMLRAMLPPVDPETLEPLPTRRRRSA